MRLNRILMNAAPTEGGGAATTTTSASTTTPSPTPTVADAGTVANVTVSAEEYKRLLDAQSKLAEADALKDRELNESKQREIDALAKKGEVDTALAKLREDSANDLKKERDKTAGLETQILTDKKGSEITGLMLGTDFVSEAAATQVRQILDARFEAVRDANGVVTVREKGTLKPAATVVKDWLASPESAHFRKASTTGGAGANGSDQSGPVDPNKPQTVSEALIAREKARLASPSNSHYGLAWRPPAK